LYSLFWESYSGFAFNQSSMPMNTCRLLVSIFLLFSVLVASARQQPDSYIVVMTYNIRFNNPDDSVNAWPNRSSKVIGMIREQKPAIFGLQEVLVAEVTEIEKAFPAYKRVGVGRDDGKEMGEFSPVFYDTTLFHALVTGTFWLSQTPSAAGSRGWDAACNRVVSWVRLVEISSGKELVYFNTHFDHMGEVARRNSAYLLASAVDSLAGKRPAIITGDFNSTPGSEPLTILMEKNKPELLFTDACSVAESKQGPDYTYTGFKVGGIPGEQIDYVFIKNCGRVHSCSVISKNDGNCYPSDHLPVVVKLSF